MTGDESGRPGIPEILRARGYRLYGRGGTRYIDFYQNAGFAMTGHRPEGLLQAFKSTAAKGLCAEYPTLRQGRAERLLREMFPFVERVFLYPDLGTALEALSAYFRQAVEPRETPMGFWGEENLEAAGEEGESLRILRWRPFALSEEETTQLSEGKFGEVFIPVIPYPGSFLPVAVCRIRGGSFDPKACSPQHRFFQADMVSPVLEALLVKAAGQVRRLLKKAPEDMWRLFDLEGASRKGPFLRFRMNRLEYGDFFTDMLKQGILLPPPSDPLRPPAIVPGEFDEGEAAPLIAEMRRRYGIG